MKIPILPDLDEQLVEYYLGNVYHIIYDDKLFIKMIFQDESNIEVLEEIEKLDLDGFNVHKKIYQDSYCKYYYLVNDYLKDTDDFWNTIKKMDMIDILKVFRVMLVNLKKAHQMHFNPFDITFRNYLINKDKEAIFVDFDTSFYKGKGSNIYIPFTIFDISYFKRDRCDFSQENLDLNDKLLVLSMLLQSLRKKYHCKSDFLSCWEDFKYIKDVYQLNLESDIIEKIAKDKMVEGDEYFTHSLIDPLIDAYQKKKTN